MEEDRSNEAPVGSNREDTGGTARGSITVAAWTLVSRVSGLLRVVVIGAVLGPTFFANTFLSANTVPNLIYTAMAGPVLALVLVPALARSLAERGVAGSREMIHRVSGYLLLCASILAAAIILVSPLVALALTAGIPDEDTRWRAWRLTVLVMLFVAPQVLGYTLASIGAAVQQTRRRFALASAAPAVENFGMIATMAVVAVWFRPGAEIPDVTLGMVCVLGAGSTLSVLAHAGTQLWGAYRVGLPIRVRGGWSSDPDARAVAQRLRASVAVAAFPVASMFAMLAVAATVPGGVFVFQTAWSMYSVISALGSKSVTVASLPGMSAAARDGDRGPLGAAWRQALTYTVLSSLPAVCLLIAFAHPVASVLSNGELRDPMIVSWLAGCLAVMAISQFANAGYEVARQTLFAQLNTAGPRQAGTAMMVLRILVGLCTLAVPADGYRLVALCVAVLLGDLMAAVICLYLVRASIRPERMVDWRMMAVIGVSTVAMLPAAVFGSWLTRELAHTQVSRVLLGLGMGLVAAACFGLVFVLLTKQFHALLGKLRARLPG